jgi:hypothetical protein
MTDRNELRAAIDSLLDGWFPMTSAALRAGCSERLMAAVAPVLDKQQAEIDRLHSWDGLMELLDEHWPADIFTGESGDPGPRIVALIRMVDQARAAAATSSGDER